MKKLRVLAIAVAMSFVAAARPPHGGCRPGPGPRHHGGYHHHHHDSWWGRGGRNFWPAFAGGVVGGMIGGGYCYGRTTVVTPAVVPVVTPVQPVITTVPVVPVVQPMPVEAYQQVWVPGALVPVTRPDGTVTYVRQPGHYERVRIQ